MILWVFSQNQFGSMYDLLYSTFCSRQGPLAELFWFYHQDQRLIFPCHHFHPCCLETGATGWGLNEGFILNQDLWCCFLVFNIYINNHKKRHLHLLFNLLWISIPHYVLSLINLNGVRKRKKEKTPIYQTHFVISLSVVIL